MPSAATWFFGVGVRVLLLSTSTNMFLGTPTRWCHRGVKMVQAFQPPISSSRVRSYYPTAHAVEQLRESRSRRFDFSTTRLWSSFQQDQYGRNIRQGRAGDDGNDDFGGGFEDDDWGAKTSGRPQRQSRGRGATGWDDDEDGWGAPAPRRGRSSNDGWGNDDGSDGGDWHSNYTPKPRSNRRSPPRDRRDNNSQYDSRRGGRRRDGGGRGGRPNTPYNNRNNNNSRNKESTSRAINMNALEGAGFVHLYGLASILNALEANRRDLTTVQERSEDSWLDGDDDDDFGGGSESSIREPPKPQAQFRPYLFVQERKVSNNRKGQKATDSERVMALAEERGVPVAEVDKGVLNTLSGNRPHQGFVLRCGKLFFESLSRVPLPEQEKSSTEEAIPSLWLVLDEVVDPQNLGALVRSSYFLGQESLGVLVCSKNSAPPTPVVSAASAGALELVTVYSTNNLPRTLNQAREDGFRIIGASSSVPSGSSSDVSENGEPMAPPLYDLQDLPVGEQDRRPVLLVLGSEGHGLRTLVAKACTEFVRIPSGFGGEGHGGASGVDSLNVSVTGGILLWQLLSGKREGN